MYQPYGKRAAIYDRDHRRGSTPRHAIAGLSLSLGTVWGVTADAAGNTYLSSSGLNLVFRLDANGALSRVAGNARQGYSGDGGPAIDAQLNDPRGLAVDGAGNLFIADWGNGRVRKVSRDGLIATIAGDGACCSSGGGGPAIHAALHTPFAVATDGAGNVFVSDLYNSRVRKISADGIISTLAGDGTYGFSGDGGPAAKAQLNAPAGVATDGSGNVLIADYLNRRIRKVSADGVINTVAGDAAANSRLIGSLGIAPDGAGNLLIADYAGVLKLSQDGTTTTVAGSGRTWFTSADGGPASAAAILPVGVATDASGNLIIADGISNSRIAKSRLRESSPLSGNGNYCWFSGDGGPAASAQLNDPASVATDENENLYIADAKNNRIRKVSADGGISTVAAACYSPDDIGAACGRAIDRAGNLYVSDDSGTFRISSAGSRTKLSDHRLGLAVDGAGNLFVADQFSNVIREVSSAGVSRIVAGNGASGFRATADPPLPRS